MAMVVGLGELLWDRGPSGETIGGAPFNVVAHLATLGHRVAFATALGRDPLGDAALRELRARGIDASLVARVDGVPTGVARVVPGADGGPAFEIVRPAAYESLQLGPDDVDRLAALEPAALVFGTLAHHGGALLAATRVLATRCAAAVRVYDVNLREGWWTPALVRELAELATVVKLSEHEAPAVADALGVAWSGAAEPLARALAAACGARAVAITAGARGASLLLDGAFASAAPPATSVVGATGPAAAIGASDAATGPPDAIPATGPADAIGAGDAFTAGLVDGILRGAPTGTALARSNALGALVASRVGALPAWTRAELAALERHGRPSDPRRTV